MISESEGWAVMKQRIRKLRNREEDAKMDEW